MLITLRVVMMAKNKSGRLVVELWCEGNVEEEYFKGLTGELELGHVRFDIKNLGGGNYGSIWRKLKNPYLDKVMIVVDLDRAKCDKVEAENLDKLISYVKKNKGNRFLFLTCENFEDWLRYHFIDGAQKSRERMYEKFGVRGEQDFKRDCENIYERVKQKGGDIAYAESYFGNLRERQGVFCDEDCGIIKKANIGNLQSTLCKFREVVRNLKP